MSLSARSPVEKPEIVADHADFAEHFGTVSGDVRPADAFGDFPIADNVSGSDFEDEIAGDGVHLTAPHLRNVEPVLYGRDDFFLGMFSRGQIRGTHAYEGFARIRLPSRMSGGFGAEEFGGSVLVHVRNEYALLDEDGFLCRIPFVVERIKTAKSRNRRIVDDGHFFGSDLFADFSTVDARILQIRFESVPDGLVDNRSAGFAADDDVHFPGRNRVARE